MKLLGIDPGTAATGWGVVDASDPENLKSIDFGNVKTTTDQLMSERLYKIYNSFIYLVEKHSPDAIIIERLFFNTNVKTAISVGQARGIYILVAGKFGIPVFEYTALQAKMELTGYGRSDKKVVKASVAKILKIKKELIKPIDASDALALAICHNIKVLKEDKTKK